MLKSRSPIKASLVAGGALLLTIAAGQAAIVNGFTDDFEDGTTSFWVEGALSPNPPSNITTGGPGGAGDRYLQNVASGGFGAGSGMIMFNQGPNWTGDYLGAGVNTITGMMANFGSNPLTMRVAVQGAIGNQYASTSGIAVPADGVWRPVAFDLADMTLVAGSSALDEVLGNVSEIRLLSSPSPAWRGEPVATTLGVDDLTAVPEPSSAVLLVMGVLGRVLFRRNSNKI